MTNNASAYTHPEETVYREPVTSPTVPKDKFIAYITWLLLGLFGVHLFYLGEDKRGRRTLTISSITAFTLAGSGALMLMAVASEQSVFALASWGVFAVSCIFFLLFLYRWVEDGIRIPRLARGEYTYQVKADTKPKSLR